MTKKILKESASGSAVKKDPIMEQIEAIKAAKRAQLAEEQGNRDTDNVGEDNSKITADKGDYEDGHKHIGDSTAEWVYEGDDSDAEGKANDKDDEKADTKDGEKAADEDAKEDKEDKKDDAGKSEDDDAIKEMADKISQHLGKLSEEESLESAIAPELESSGEGVEKEEDAGDMGNPDATDHNLGPSVDLAKPVNTPNASSGGDKQPVSEEANRDTDNVSADNSKIQNGKGKYNNPKALDHSKEPNPEDMAESFVTKEDFDLSEDMQAILGSSESLSEEFKTRVETIFGAAVVAKANQVIKEALDIMKEDMTAYRAQLDEKYEAQIDKYLNVIVEEWATENKQTLIENTRYDLSQSLMEGIKGLFEQHYIEMPKSKLDVFDKLVEENVGLEDQVNKLLAEKVELTNKVKSVKKAQALAESTAGLTLSQVEKVKVLAESIDYVTDVDFKVKLDEVKKAYFTKPVKSRSIEKDTTPVVLHEEVRPLVDDEVAGAVEFLSRKI